MRLRARLLVAAALAAAGLLLVARRLLELVSPFFIALIVAAVADPIVDRLERWGVPRALGALVAIGGLCLTVGLFVWVLAVNVTRELALLHQQLPEVAARIDALVAAWGELVKPLLQAVPHPLDDALLGSGQALLEGAGALVSQLLSRLAALPDTGAVLFVSGTSAYFLIRDKRELGAFALKLLPRRWRDELRRIKREVAAGLAGFLRAQSILVAVSGALSVTGLTLFGYRYAWLLGLLAGVFDLVPMVGPSAVFAPLVAYGLLVGEFARAAGVAAVWGSVLVVRQVIEPEIVGRRVGLHPLTSVVAVYVGGKLFGVNGALLGPVIAVALKAVCAVSVLPYIEQE